MNWWYLERSIKMLCRVATAWILHLFRLNWLRSLAYYNRHRWIAGRHVWSPKVSGGTNVSYKMGSWSFRGRSSLINVHWLPPSMISRNSEDWLKINLIRTFSIRPDMACTVEDTVCLISVVSMIRHQRSRVVLPYRLCYAVQTFLRLDSQNWWSLLVQLKHLISFASRLFITFIELPSLEVVVSCLIDFQK